ncbi:hypothetical protein TWF696_003217 [Orbilia brochopaga]|uniref:F-box domain-containing protein n=1 Tax=Orbilia brochopaga TaxID=3140254 RepID=A0AAV9U208_9PEZI
MTWANSIFLPPELVFEVVAHCDAPELRALAQTSRDSYEFCLREQIINHRHPLTLPHAVTSGWLDERKTDGLYDHISAVAIDVSEDIWLDALNPNDAQVDAEFDRTRLDPLYDLLLSRSRRGKTTSLHIYTHGEKDCNVFLLVDIITHAFWIAPDAIDSLAIDVSVAECDETTLHAYARERAHDVRSLGLFKGGRTCAPVTSLAISALAVNADDVFKSLVGMASSVIAKGPSVEVPLESLSMAVRWKPYSNASSNKSDAQGRGYALDRVSVYTFTFNFTISATLQRLHFEDRGLSSHLPASGWSYPEAHLVWPKLAEIQVDMGLEHSANSEQSLVLFGHDGDGRTQFEIRR